MKTTILSTIVLVLILQGCGSSTSNNKKEESNTTSSSKVSNEVKSFAKGLVHGDSVSSLVKGTGSSETETETESNSSKTQTSQKTTLDSCTNGGTRAVTSDMDPENFEHMDRATRIKSIEERIKNGFTLTIVTDNCIEEGMKSNGSMSMRLGGEDLKITTLTFTEDLTFEDLETTEVLTIFKNSTMKIEELSEDKEITTETLQVTSSTRESHQFINLVTHSTSSENNESSYKISGKMVQDGVTYRVDEKYDSSKTPMVFKNDDDLVSGTSKYYNEKNHHITISVVAKNQIKISVDTDNDGKNDQEEIVDL